MKYLIILFFIVCALSFSGCAPSPYVKQGLPPTAGVPGKYHKVEHGQTLWRISKIYNVELDEIVSLNHISDAAKIETGQLIFIPAQQPRQRAQEENSSAEDFIWPIKGRVAVTFGQTYKNMINKGINIQSYASDVSASRSGKVAFVAENFGGFGKTVILDHGDGYSSVYAMNSQILVKPGDFAQKGSGIAKASNLHFEIRKGHIPKNPLFYLP